MSSLKEILHNYLYLGIIFAIFLIFLVIFVLLTSKKKGKKNIYLTGLLIDMDNKQIFALALILINFLLLIYTLIFKINLTTSLILVSIFIILLAFIINNKAKYMLINGTINLVNISIIYLANLVNTLRVDNTGFTYLLLQIVLNIFGILFYIFTTFKFIKNLKGE